MFESQHGVIVYDEAKSISAYVREFTANETSTFPRPDQVLDRLSKLAASSTVIFSDADALCDGAVMELARRVAPQKSIRCICATKPQLPRALETAFGGLSGAAAGTNKDDNVGRRSFLHRVFSAVRCARTDVDDRVWVSCASLTQMQRLKAMLMQRDLWDQQRCKMYFGTSPDKADLTDTAEAWRDAYLVLCNSAVTVAINVEVRFGAAFMLTDNSPGVSVARDGDQNIVRIWRKPELEPRDGAMGRGPDGMCRIFVLLGCAAPKGLLTIEDNEKTKTRTKKTEGHIVSLLDFPAWMQKQHTKELERMQAAAADGAAKHGTKALQKLTDATMTVAAWNRVERYANTTQHFTYVMHLASLGTRDWQVRCIEPFAEDAPEHPPAGQPPSSPASPEEPASEDEDAGEDGDAGEDEELFDVAAADQAIRSFCGDEDAGYNWFIKEFVAWHERSYSFCFITQCFFYNGGEYLSFVRAITNDGKTLVDEGDGAMKRLLIGIFQTLRPIQRIVDTSETYTLLKRNEVALRRRAHFRLFTPGCLRARPLTVQPGVQDTDLVILSKLKGIASALELTLGDLLGFEPAMGGFTIGDSDEPVEPIEAGCTSVELDFKRRPPPPPGAGKTHGDMRCGGRWGFAGDVEERYKDEAHASSAIKNAWNRLLIAAKGMQISTHNATPLKLLAAVLKETVGIKLSMQRKKGNTIRGTDSKHQLIGLTLDHLAEGLSQRMSIKHIVTEIRDLTDYPEWSPAWTFGEKQRALVRNALALAQAAGTGEGGSGGSMLDTGNVQIVTHQHDADSGWQQCRTDSATEAAARAARGVVQELNAPECALDHLMPLNVDVVKQVLERLRAVEAAGVKHPLCQQNGFLRRALDESLGGFVPVPTLRVPPGCGPRCYGDAFGSSFSPHDLNVDILSVMLDGSCDCLVMEDAKLQGGLLLRLLEKHAYQQRRVLGLSSPAALDAAPPTISELEARLKAAQTLNQELKTKVFGGDESLVTAWSEAQRENTAAEEALETAREAAQAPSTSGHSVAADGLLPGTAKLEALLQGSSGDDCSALARAVLERSLPPPHQPLSPSHKDVYFESIKLIDALVSKGVGWEDLRDKLHNRKKGELKGLSSNDEKQRKEKALKTWAGTVLVERLLDDAVMHVEQQLAVLKGGTQYVQFVDVRPRIDPTRVRLYALRRLRTGKLSNTGIDHMQVKLLLPSDGRHITGTQLEVKLSLQNDELKVVGATVAAHLEQMLSEQVHA